MHLGIPSPACGLPRDPRGATPATGARPVTRAPAFAALALAGALATPALSAQETATWYIGTYSHDLLVWDEASEQVVDRIEMRSFIPTRIVVSEDRSRLYVSEASAQTVEVVDVAAGEVIDAHSLSADSVRVRIGAFAPHPSNRKAVMQITAYTKHVDRYSVAGPWVVEYDLESKTVTDTLSLPEGVTADQANFTYSPDGATLYFFARDIVAVDAETYVERERWELSKPLEPGLGRGSFGVTSGTYDQPGVATSIFRMTDPAQERAMMGIARVRLSDREVDFFTLGPSQPVGGFALAPGGERAYGLYSEVGRYEFWEFDLVGERVARRQPFAGRPRMGLRASADGDKLYVHVAGNTIDVYDVETFELMRTVTFDEDMTGTAVIPGPAPGR